MEAKRRNSLGKQVKDGIATFIVCQYHLTLTCIVLLKSGFN